MEEAVRLLKRDEFGKEVVLVGFPKWIFEKAKEALQMAKKTGAPQGFWNQFKDDPAVNPDAKMQILAHLEVIYPSWEISTEDIDL